MVTTGPQNNNLGFRNRNDGRGSQSQLRTHSLTIVQYLYPLSIC